MDRPHWWGVLAVALALMALVAALSATAGGRARTGAARAAPAARAASAARADGSAAVASVTSGAARSGPATYPLVTRYAWRLDDPSGGTAVYHQQVAGGTEGASVLGPSTASIRLMLACPGSRRAARSAKGTARIEVGLRAGSGSCTVKVAAGPSGRGVRYQLVVNRRRQ